jgi:hypothetical protein
LIAIKDMDQHHRGIFGSGANVTIGVDIALLGNERLRGVFASAERLICFAGAKPSGLEAAFRQGKRRLARSRVKFALDIGYETQAPAVGPAYLSIRCHFGDYRLGNRHPEPLRTGGRRIDDQGCVVYIEAIDTKACMLG